MATYLVTGGAGFIGSHLCVRLLKTGGRVICVDNLLTGAKENITPLLADKNFTYIEHDIIDPLMIDEPIDEIYNLACPASPKQYQKNAIRTIKANTVGVINILGLARAKGAKILQASTSEVYGDPEESPQKETYRGNVSSIGSRACYDEGKRCAEALFFDYHRTHGLAIKVVRIFNTYGPGMASDDGRVVSNFIVQALSGNDLTIYGTGTQTRSFCFVSDLVDGLIKMMATSKEVTGPINLGNPSAMTVRDLAEMVLQLSKSKSKVVSLALPEDDPSNRCPDITQAKKILNWEPAVGLQEGLQQTIADFRKR